jgi:glutathione S-transferase/RNA polymerase-associated protein
VIKLFEHPLSPYVQKVKIAMIEKGIPFEVEMPNLLAAGGDDAFRAANPRLEVPALVDGDATVYDSTIILEYLEDKWPTPPMLPAAPIDRARARTLEEICDTQYEAVNWGLFEIRVFGRAKGALAESMIARAGEQIAGLNAHLDRSLGGRDWFNGAAFGWADLSIIPHVNAAAAVNGFPPPAGSALARWLDRMRERPSVQRVSEEALASMTGFEMMPQLIESGLFVREYRDHRLEWMLRSGGTDIVLDGMKKKTIRFSAELG